MQTYENPDIDPQEWTWPSTASFTHRYGQEFKYDANGNILYQSRLDASGTSGGLIDDLQYHYYSGTNRLEYVTNTGSVNPTDHPQVPDQSATNYSYDGSGNLIRDCSELLDSIYWIHFGKVTRIKKVEGAKNTIINFGYNPQQQRIKKQEVHEIFVGGLRGLREESGCILEDPFEQPLSIDTIRTLWYIRDATGNVLAVYEQVGDTMHWKQH